MEAEPEASWAAAGAASATAAAAAEGGFFPVDPVCRLPIFHGDAASGCSVQDEISEGVGWRRAGVPASSVAGQNSCGAAAGECSAESAPAESGESAVKPDPKSAGWIRRVQVGANPIELDASKIYTRSMFEQFQLILYDAGGYRVQEIEQNVLYKATHTRPDKREKWSRVVFTVRMHDNGDRFECECGLFEHMGMLCAHVLKVMDYLGMTEIPKKHIVKRWTKGARDVLPEHLQHYQRDKISETTLTFGHNRLYVQALELVRWQILQIRKTGFPGRAIGLLVWHLQQRR